MADVVPIMTAFFGGLAVLAGAFFKYMASREKDSREERVKQTKAFGDIVDKLGEHLDRSTEAHEKSAREAEKRNGHLAELAIENKKSNAEQYAAILAAVSDMKEQHVKNQRVDKQTVVHETVKHKE